MKFVIHPDYADAADFLLGIPEGRYQVCHTYCFRRNTVELTRHAGRLYVVKRFGVPTLANRFIYTFLRKNKARRAYENALRLLAADFQTARPAAYMVQRRGGLLHTAWVVTKYLPHEPLLTVYAKASEEERSRLERDFVDYTVRLHEAGIVHRDFHASNILVKRRDCQLSQVGSAGTSDGCGYEIALIDVNRMDFGRPPSLRRAMRSFSQLSTSPDLLHRLVGLYAARRGFSPARCRLQLRLIRRRHRLRHNLKHALKRLAGKR